MAAEDRLDRIERQSLLPDGDSTVRSMAHGRYSPVRGAGGDAAERTLGRRLYRTVQPFVTIMRAQLTRVRYSAACQEAAARCWSTPVRRNTTVSLFTVLSVCWLMLVCRASPTPDPASGPVPLPPESLTAPWLALNEPPPSAPLAREGETDLAKILRRRRHQAQAKTARLQLQLPSTSANPPDFQLPRPKYPPTLECLSALQNASAGAKAGEGHLGQLSPEDNLATFDRWVDWQLRFKTPYWSNSSTTHFLSDGWTREEYLQWLNLDARASENIDGHPLRKWTPELFSREFLLEQQKLFERPGYLGELDARYELYGGSGEREPLRRLFDVQVMVPTSSQFHRTRDDVLMRTWASDFPPGHIFFYSDAEDDRLPAINVMPGAGGAQGKRVSEIKYVRALQHGFLYGLQNGRKWFQLIDDDAFLSAGNLGRFLRRYVGREEIVEFYGDACAYPTDYDPTQRACGGAGILFSRPLAIRLLSLLDCCYRYDEIEFSDVFISYCIMGEIDSAAFKHSPFMHREAHNDTRFYRRGYYDSITFHYARPKELQFELYKLYRAFDTRPFEPDEEIEPDDGMESLG